MSSASRLSALHSSLAAETGRLLSLEVGVEVEARDRDTRILQVDQVTSSQGEQVPVLEGENVRLRREVEDAGHRKAELGHRVTHTYRELQVLSAQWTQVWGEVERMKGDTGADCQAKVDSVEGITQAVRELRINHGREVEGDRRNIEEMHTQAGRQSQALDKSNQEQSQLIVTMKQQLEGKKKQREMMNMEVEDVQGQP